MALTINPKAGMIVVCDFAGYVLPEIIKTRPVVIISPKHWVRPALFSVVPLSTTPPNPVQPYHYKLAGNPMVPANSEVWAKCDLVASVSIRRLDRVKVSRGNYQIFHISNTELMAIRKCVGISVGALTPEGRLIHT